MYTQKFREINYSGVNSDNQIPLPVLKQTNFLFDLRMSLSQNITRSLRLNYSATNSNIISEDTNFQNSIWEFLIIFSIPVHQIILARV